MLIYVARRLLLLVIMLLGLATITFAITNIAPGDPARLIAGPNATESMVETVRQQNGLDRPLIEQYGVYMTGLVQGDLGRSIVSTRPVVDELMRYFPATLELVVVAMGLGIVFGVGFGILSAVVRDSWFDHVVRIGSISGVALPAFWFGILLQLLFAVQMGWLPISGRLNLVTLPPDPITHFLLIDSLLRGQFDVFTEAFSYIIMPAVVLSFPCLASILRVNRSEMIEALQSDFVLAAKANGLSAWRIVTVYALKNAMLPTVSIIGLRFGWMLGSTILVETVFDWPGIGLYAVESALYSDFKPVIGATLLIGFIFMIINFMVDLAYIWLDPRLRESG